MTPLPEYVGDIQLAAYLHHPRPWELAEEIPLWWRARIIAVANAEAVAQKQALKPT